MTASLASLPRSLARRFANALRSRLEWSRSASGPGVRFLCSVALLSVLQTLLSHGIANSAEPAQLPPEPVPVATSAAAMKLPSGFQATLFAGEPDVVQPIAFTFDDRGRMWVVECLSYPHWHRDNKGNDRVTILEDTNGDGVHDKRTVFLDNGVNLSGIEYGFGGIWLSAPPYLLFVPDRNGDDKPDAAPEVRLDGWSLDAKHNVVNALKWGPDGWLWGCNGILSKSRIGAPGTPDEQRTPIDCGVWRYHPVKNRFEWIASGSTNPWGLDFDDFGEAFITNCVIKHLFHIVPGAHYQRMFGNDLNPHSYNLIESCADHIHWAGGHWTNSRGNQPEHDDAGGGHAHSGCAVLLNDTWPAEYRNSVFMCNIHGNRLNRDTLKHTGSSYTASHAADFMRSPDPWFRGIAVHQGPNGDLFVSDWSDTGECHNYEVAHTTSGRIYRIHYSGTNTPRATASRAPRSAVTGRKTPSTANLVERTDRELLDLQSSGDDWAVRHARRILHERASAGKLTPETLAALRAAASGEFSAGSDAAAFTVPQQLRQLWALHAVAAESALPELLNLLKYPEERIRGWSVRLLVDTPTDNPQIIDALSRLAATEKSPVVQLALAGALQRIPVEARWPIIESLAANKDAADDAVLPHMLWYGMSDAVVADRTGRALKLCLSTPLQLIRQSVARRVAAASGLGTGDAPPPGLKDVLAAVVASDSSLVQSDLLFGVDTVLIGRSKLIPPADWNPLLQTVFSKLASSPLGSVRKSGLRLGLLCGDEQVAKLLRTTVGSADSSPDDALLAIELLADRSDPELVPALYQRLNKNSLVRPAAIRALARFDSKETPEKLLAALNNLSSSERTDVIQTLTSRPTFAIALLDAIEAKRIDRKEISAFTIRQLASLNDPSVTKRITEVWGTLRPASADKVARTSALKEQLTADTLKQANLSNGRKLFAKNCASCHRLFDAGERIAPELTGSQRANLDYVLENVLDPNAVVPGDYRVSIFQLHSGRTVSGMIMSENERAVTVQTQNEILTLSVSDIEERTKSELSMMPEGLLDQLSPTEIRDLVSYLASPNQVEMPGE